ncbi:MAG: hypothetical protein E6J62_19550 [Deltaproteobacteria bacterium]|nr:MAG: hypothetical protein E6J62_19550 [Deltaproteobacteria bacterium]
MTIDYYLHLIAEAENRAALSRGGQGLAIRVAKALNAALLRHGKVFSERFHVLRTVREVANAVDYVALELVPPRRQGGRHR